MSCLRLAAVLFFISASFTLHAATVNVPLGTSINTAINGANADDVIQLEAGTYDEAVVINKRITLAGSTTGVTIIQNVTATNTGTGIDVQNSGGGSTVQNVTVQNFQYGLAVMGAGFNGLTVSDSSFINNHVFGIFVQGFNPSNLSFDNLVVTNNGAGETFGRGIWVINGDKTNISITDSTFSNNRLVGIDISDGTVSGLTISGNTVEGNGDSGIAVLGAVAGSTNVISNNVVSNNGRFGIEIKGCVGNGAASGAGSFVLRGNTVSLATPFAETAPAGRDFAGIVVMQRSTPAPAGIVVVENTVSGYARGTGTGDGFGIVFEGNNHVIRQNLVTGCDVGIQIQAGNTVNTLGTPFFDRGEAPTATNPTIIHNNLSNNVVGLRNANAGTVVSTSNAWGVDSGPTTAANPGGLGASADSVAGGVAITFAPWLIYNTDASANAGYQLPTTVGVTARADVSAANNNYRILANAIACAVAGQTLNLSGNFDWRETNAAASWALGPDAVASNSDDFSILAPIDVNGVTITSPASNATIQGPGDLPNESLECFLTFNGNGLNQNWTISNLRILDFDLSIGFFNGSAPTTVYNNTVIENNFFRIPVDLNPTVAPTDNLQNIGLHFSFGTNQRISDNEFEVVGTGLSNGTQRSSTVVMQSNTSGGSAYNGLQISGNEIRVTGTPAADPARILGIWENSHGHTSNITVSNNSFVNDTPNLSPLQNQQFAFRITSHSSATSTVRYEDNAVEGANTGFEWLIGQNFSGNQPVQLIDNTTQSVANAYLIRSQARAYISGAEATGFGAGTTGLNVDETSQVKVDADATGGGRNNFNGFGIGLLANNSTVFLENTTLRDNVTAGIRLTGTSLLDAGANVADPTGLNGGAASFGGNILQGYSATVPAIDNQVLATAQARQHAMRNSFDFLAADRIEERVFHAADDVTKGLVFFAEQNTIPLATSLTLAKASPLTVNLAGTGTVTDYEILTLPVNGTLAFGSTAITSAPVRLSAGGATQSLTYTATTTGNDSFTYRVHNGEVRSMPATVTIQNNAPNATGQAVTVLGTEPTTIFLNGSDADSVDTLIYLVGTAQKGGLTGTAPNLTYRAVAGSIGSDAFTYRVFDGVALSAETTVTITILPTTAPNFTSAATAVPNPATVGTAVSLTVAGVDPDGSAVSTAWDFGDSTTGAGDATTHTYTIPGVYTVVATITDGQGETAISTVTVTIVAAATPEVTQPLTILKKRLSAKNPSIGKDKVTLSGTFNLPTVDTNLAGTATAQFGALSVQFPLSAKGSGKSTGGALKVTGKRKKGVLATTGVKFSVTVVGNVQQVLQTAGIAAGQSGNVTIPFRLTVANTIYAADIPLTIKGRPTGSTGK